MACGSRIVFLSGVKELTYREPSVKRQRKMRERERERERRSVCHGEKNPC